MRVHLNLQCQSYTCDRQDSRDLSNANVWPGFAGCLPNPHSWLPQEVNSEDTPTWVHMIPAVRIPASGPLDDSPDVLSPSAPSLGESGPGPGG